MRNSKNLYICNLVFINYTDALKYCTKHGLDDVLISNTKLYWYKILRKDVFPKYYAKLDLDSETVAYNYPLSQTAMKQHHLKRIFLIY